MSRDNLGSKQTIVLHNCLIENDRYDLVITPHRQTIGYFREKINPKKDNHNKTRANYQKTTIKTMKPSLRIRNKHKTGTSRLKRFNKKTQ